MYAVLRRTREEGTRDASYYHLDHLGSSNVITDASGNLVEHYEYTPYGTTAVQEIVSRPSSLLHHKFTGKELDSTGLYYYGARYYDPKIGRFITPDPIIQDLYDPQTLNSYTYCRNNPLRYIDPTGEAFGDSMYSNSRNFWLGDNPKGFASGVFNTVVAASSATLGVAMLPGAFLATPFMGALGWVAGVTGSASLGAATGMAITGKDLSGRPLTEYQREELKGTVAVGWLTLGVGAWGQFKDTGKLFGINKVLDVYRRGTFSGGSYIKGDKWAPKNPATIPDYAKKYGLPAENSGSPDWIIKGRVHGSYVSGPTPASHNAPRNTGGAIEIIPNNPDDVVLDWFHMPN